MEANKKYSNFAEQREAAILSLAVLITTIYGLIRAITHDPEIKALVEDWVGLEIQKNGLPPEKKNIYVQTTMEAIQKGATDIAKKFQEQQQEQQKGQQQSPQSVPQTQQKQYPGTTGVVGSSEDTIIKKAQNEEPTTGGNLAEWGTDVINDALFNLGNWFSGKNSDQLKEQIVELMVRKELLNEKYRDQFKTYLDEFAKRGFTEIKEKVQKEEQEKKQQESSGMLSQNQVQQKINQMQSQGLSYDQAKQQLLGITFMGDDGRQRTIDDYQANAWLQNYGGQSSQTSGNLQNALTEIAPDYTKQDTTQLGAWLAGAMEAVTNAMTTYGMTQDEAVEWLSKQESAQSYSNQTPTASFDADRVKYSYLQWLPKLLKYGPVTYKVVKTILEFMKKESNIKFNERSKYANINETLNTVINAIQEILNGKATNLAIAIMDILGIDKKDTESLRNSLNSALDGINKFLLNFNEEEEDSVNKDNDITSDDIDTLVAAGFVQINSKNFSIRKGNIYYDDIENTIKKIAEENKIDNVNEIEIKILPDTGLMFYKKEAIEVNILSGLATGLMERFLGEPSSWGETSVMSLAGGLSNMGFPIGAAIAKYFGAGTVGKLVSGGLGAFITYLLSDTDDDKKKAALEDAYTGSMQNADVQLIAEKMAENQNISKREAWAQILKMQNMGLGSYSSRIEKMAEDLGISLEEAWATATGWKYNQS